VEFQSAYERNLETIPVGELGIIALKSCETLGKKIDAHIAQWRQEREHEP
jgi:ribose-phosphate pyrophosphokinase